MPTRSQMPRTWPGLGTTKTWLGYLICKYKIGNTVFNLTAQVHRLVLAPWTCEGPRIFFFTIAYLICQISWELTRQSWRPDFGSHLSAHSSFFKRFYFSYGAMAEQDDTCFAGSTQQLKTENQSMMRCFVLPYMPELETRLWGTFRRIPLF